MNIFYILIVMIFSFDLACGNDFGVSCRILWLEEKSGKIEIILSNSNQYDIFMRLSDIQHPSYRLFGAGVSSGASGGNPGDDLDIYILIRSNQKKRIPFELKSYRDLAPKHIESIELVFNAHAYFYQEGILNEKKINMTCSQITPR